MNISRPERLKSFVDEDFIFPFGLHQQHLVRLDAAVGYFHAGAQPPGAVRAALDFLGGDVPLDVISADLPSAAESKSARHARGCLYGAQIMCLVQIHAP